MPENLAEPGTSARTVKARRKSPGRQLPADGRLRAKRAYLLRNQGAVVDGLDRPSQKTEQGEQAQRREVHEDALLVACIAFAVFALWFLPVADTRFF